MKGADSPIIVGWNVTVTFLVFALMTPSAHSSSDSLSSPVFVTPVLAESRAPPSFDVSVGDIAVCVDSFGTLAVRLRVGYRRMS